MRTATEFTVLSWMWGERAWTWNYFQYSHRNGWGFQPTIFMVMPLPRAIPLGWHEAGLWPLNSCESQIVCPKLDAHALRDEDVTPGSPSASLLQSHRSGNSDDEFPAIRRFEMEFHREEFADDRDVGRDVIVGCHGGEAAGSGQRHGQ